jgi:hypothetical protein
MSRDRDAQCRATATRSRAVGATHVAQIATRTLHSTTTSRAFTSGNHDRMYEMANAVLYGTDAATLFVRKSESLNRGWDIRAGWTEPQSGNWYGDALI